MFRQTMMTGVGALALIAAQASAQSDEAKRFGAREEVSQVSLSPSGGKFAAIVNLPGRAQRVVVGDAVNPDQPIKSVLSASGDPEHVGYCQWASDTRLVCNVGTVIGKGTDRRDFSRLLTLNADGSDMKLLTARDSLDATQIRQSGGSVIDWQGGGAAQGEGSLLMTRQFVPEYGTGSYTADTRQGFGVERVDPTTLRRTVVEAPKPTAREYITDGRGTIRIVGNRATASSGYDAATMTYSYRRVGSRDWQKLSEVTGDSQTETGFDPYAVDPTLNVAYGFDNNDGRQALFKVALDGTLKRELVYARPDVDIDGLVRIGRQHRVVGVSYATDYRRTDFFDPELKKLGRALSKALPGLPLISFVDASADENKLLLYVGSDVDPGHFAIFDKKTRHLDTLLEARPALDKVTLAPTKAITFTARDGTAIPAYLTVPVGGTGKNLPAIVMPHGGPSARDEWGFDWLVQFFVARGYAVLQPNYRGSSGYGQAWFQNNGFRSWRTAIGDVDDGGHWLVKEGIADPARLAIVGWSYGGYAALQSPVLEPDLFKAIIAIAPVTDLETLRNEHRDFTDFKLVDAFIGRGAHVREGSPAQNAAKIKAPVLLFHGTIDDNVGVGESRLMAGRLKKAGGKVELVEFAGLDHQLDDSNARTTMLDKADTFLRKSMGM